MFLGPAIRIDGFANFGYISDDIADDESGESNLMCLRLIKWRATQRYCFQSSVKNLNNPKIVHGLMGVVYWVFGTVYNMVTIA